MSEPRFVRLGDVAHVTMGQSPDSKFYNDRGDGHPFLQGCGQFGARFPEAAVFCSTPSKLAPIGSILFSVRAPVGEINIADKEYCIGRGLAAITPQRIDPRLLYYVLNHVAPQFKRIAQGSTFEAVSTSDVLDFLIPNFESLEVQTAIADVLATVDRAIAQTEALIAKQRRIKAGLMHDLLTRGIDEAGNLRHPSTHKFKQSAVGLVPVEWEVVRLGSVAQIGSGVTLGRSVSGTDTIELPYLRVANVQDGYVDLSEIKTVRIFKHEMARFLLESGDVLMNEGGDYDKLGRGTVWKGQISPCLHQNHVFRVRAKRAKLLPDFLALVSASPYGKQFFVLSSKQSTNLASINSTQLKAFPIPLPPIQEQATVIEVLSASDSVLETETTRLSKLHRLKTGLMQDLLTGRVSVEELLEKIGSEEA